MLFQGKFKDQETGRVGHLVVAMLGTNTNVRVRADVQFVSEAKGN
jgi:hypothetical protein